MALNIFKRFFSDKQVPDPHPDRPNTYIQRPAQGAALAAIPAAYAAVGLLSTTLAQLPRTVAQIEDPIDDYWSPNAAHPVSELLRKPSAILDPWLFWEQMFRCLFGGGNAYAWIRRDGHGRPIELVPATTTGNGPAWVKTRDGIVGVEYTLSLWDDGETRLEGVSSGDVVALHGPGFNGLTSPSPVQYAARRTLEVMDQASKHQSDLLRGGGLRAAIETDVKMLDPEFIKKHREQLLEQLRETYSEAREEGRIPVLPPGFTMASSGGMSVVDIQVIELLRWSVEDIARVWNVPPRLLHHYHEGFRVAAFEQQAVDYERWSVRGHVHRVEEQLSAKLLSAEEVAGNLAIRLPTDRIRAGSWSERVNAVDQAVAKAGIMSINEGRRQLRLPDRPDGDKLLQPKGAPAQNNES